MKVIMYSISVIIVIITNTCKVFLSFFFFVLSAEALFFCSVIMNLFLRKYILQSMNNVICVGMMVQ